MNDWRSVVMIQYRIFADKSWNRTTCTTCMSEKWCLITEAEPADILQQDENDEDDEEESQSAITEIRFIPADKSMCKWVHPEWLWVRRNLGLEHTSRELGVRGIALLATSYSAHTVSGVDVGKHVAWRRKPSPDRLHTNSSDAYWRKL